MVKFWVVKLEEKLRVGAWRWGWGGSQNLRIWGSRFTGSDRYVECSHG